MQFAAAIATDGDQVHLVRVRAHVQLPGAAQHDVDHERAIAHEAFHRLVVGKPQLEAGIAIGQCLAKRGNRVACGCQRGGQRCQEGPRSRSEGGRARVQVVDWSQRCAHAGGCSLAPSVRTSWPLGVTRIVCSH